MVVALIALGVALGGTSVAATTGLVTGTQLRGAEAAAIGGSAPTPAASDGSGAAVRRLSWRQARSASAPATAALVSSASVDSAGHLSVHVRPVADRGSSKRAGSRTVAATSGRVPGPAYHGKNEIGFGYQRTARETTNPARSQRQPAQLPWPVRLAIRLEDLHSGLQSGDPTAASQRPRRLGSCCRGMLEVADARR